MSYSIVTISGWAGTRQVWKPLDDQGIAYTYIPWQEYVQDAQAWKDKLAAIEGSILIIAWSLGSLIAFDLVSDGALDNATLVLISATASITEQEHYPGVPQRLLNAMRKRLARNRQEVVQDFAEKSFIDDEHRKDFIKMADEFTDDELAYGLKFLAETDLRQKTAAIKNRIYLIHGEQDAIVPCEQAQVLKESLSSSSLTVMPNRGHGLALSSPETYLATVMKVCDEQNN